MAIQVADDGCGIQAQALQHLFDGSGIGHDSAAESDSARTMGIGLSVCKTIVTAHGGTMRAKNLLSGGACFTFTLPMEEIPNGITTENSDC